MSATVALPEDAGEPILGPVERVSEMCFGLFMAITFAGALSVVTPGGSEVRTMVFAALGCNLAWGLVDAVMHLVRTLTERGRTLSLALRVRRAADAESGRRVVADALSRVASKLVSDAEVEAIRARIVALPALPDRPHLTERDAAAAIVIFFIVVAATFPVVLPFVFIDDLGVAKTVSRLLALAMLFLGGWELGRHAGGGELRTGFSMVGLGTALVVAIMALGG
jgi:hypothetical protein